MKILTPARCLDGVPAFREIDALEALTDSGLKPREAVALLHRSRLESVATEGDWTIASLGYDKTFGNLYSIRNASSTQCGFGRGGCSVSTWHDCRLPQGHDGSHLCSYCGSRF